MVFRPDDLHCVVMNLVIFFFEFFGTRPFTLVVQYLFFCDFHCVVMNIFTIFFFFYLQCVVMNLVIIF